MIANIFLALSFLFDIGSFQFQRVNLVLTCHSISWTCIAAHFLVRQDVTAAVFVAPLIVQAVVAVRSKNQSTKQVFLFGQGILSLSRVQSSLDILGCIASLLYSCAGFQGEQRKLRIGMMISSSLWITYHLATSNIGGTSLELSFLTSNIVGYWRYRRSQSLMGVL